MFEVAEPALAEALPLAREALAIRERSSGPDHPSTGASLSNLALLLQDMGDYRRLPELDPTDVEMTDFGLPKVAEQALEGALAAADTAHARYSFALDAGTFVVALADPEEGMGEAGRHGDARLVLEAVREAVGGIKEWRTLRILYMARYKHRLGRIEERPTLLVEIDREVVDHLVVENMDAAEVWSLFSASHPQHDGWKRVD